MKEQVCLQFIKTYFPRFPARVWKPSCPLPPSTAGKQRLRRRNTESAGGILRRVHAASSICFCRHATCRNATYKTRFSHEAATRTSRPGDECLARGASRRTGYRAETARFQCGIFFVVFFFMRRTMTTNRIATLCRNLAKTSSSNTAAVHSTVCLMQFYSPAFPGNGHQWWGKKKKGRRKNFLWRNSINMAWKKKKNPKKTNITMGEWILCGIQRIVYYYFLPRQTPWWLSWKNKNKTFNNLYYFGINSILLFFGGCLQWAHWCLRLLAVKNV